MHVSQSTALRDAKILPSKVVTDFRAANCFEEGAKKLLEEIVKFQQNKNPVKWTYFTVEEFTKSRNLHCLTQEELSALNNLVNLRYLHKSGVYYHVSNKLLEVLKLIAKPNLN